MNALTILQEVGSFIVKADNLKSVVEFLRKLCQKISDIPNALFLKKLEIIFRDLDNKQLPLEERVKVAQKIREFVDKDEDYQFRVLSIIDRIDDDRKIKYYTSLLVCGIIFELKEELLFKLINIIEKCTSFDLDYIKDYDYKKENLLNTRISYLFNDGLFEFCDETENEVRYRLSGLAVALKQNSLNYEEELNGIPRIKRIEEIRQYPVVEPMTSKELDEILL